MVKEIQPYIRSTTLSPSLLCRCNRNMLLWKLRPAVHQC